MHCLISLLSQEKKIMCRHKKPRDWWYHTQWLVPVNGVVCGGFTHTDMNLWCKLSLSLFLLRFDAGGRLQPRSSDWLIHLHPRKSSAPTRYNSRSAAVQQQWDKNRRTKHRLKLLTATPVIFKEGEDVPILSLSAVSRRRRWSEGIVLVEGERITLLSKCCMYSKESAALCGLFSELGSERHSGDLDSRHEGIFWDFGMHRARDSCRISRHKGILYIGYFADSAFAWTLWAIFYRLSMVYKTSLKEVKSLYIIYICIYR